MIKLLQFIQSKPRPVTLREESHMISAQAGVNVSAFWDPCRAVVFYCKRIMLSSWWKRSLIRGGEWMCKGWNTDFLIRSMLHKLQEVYTRVQYVLVVLCQSRFAACALQEKHNNSKATRRFQESPTEFQRCDFRFKNSSLPSHGRWQ